MPEVMRQCKVLRSAKCKMPRGGKVDLLAKNRSLNDRKQGARTVSGNLGNGQLRISRLQSNNLTRGHSAILYNATEKRLLCIFYSYPPHLTMDVYMLM